jgi:acyl-CoA synthetase (AMP-forming)/AMP-acid ligase II
VSALVHPGARLVDAASGEVFTDLTVAAEAIAALPPGVLFARTTLDMPAVLRYIGAFEAGRAIALIDPALDADVLAELIDRFRPAAVLGADTSFDGYAPADVMGPALVRTSADSVVPHPDLAVLLPTSGSTGNPKLVRLSREAMLSNADAIATVLGITADEVAPTTLPLHYSYGLSVLNSHLTRGATVLVEGNGVMARPFWQAAEKYEITSLAGVPYHYEMLRRLRFDPAKYPSLRTITQAGGRLRTELVTEFNDKMLAVGGRMFVMYGQTEAAPRMSTVPAERLAEKLGSAGPALPGGAFSVRMADGNETTQAGITGEIVYRGPNVMMGYAETAAELAEGDVVGGMLVTGDLGYLDEDGFLFITGRLKRIGKIFGNRVSLDDLENAVKQYGAAAAVAAGDKVAIWIEGAPADACKAAAKALSERLHLHVTGFDVRGIDSFPLLPSGKIDYRSLEARA